MATLRVRLLGRVCIQHGQSSLEGLDLRKVQELFCYLLLYRDRPHHRETLASILWEEASMNQSKANLRKALWQLQAALSECCATSEHHILVVDSDWIQINPRADLWLDVALLEQAFTHVKGLSGEQIHAEHACAIEQAVQVYHGDLLDGWYQDWCVYERERLQNIYLALLNKLMDHCETHHAYEQGLVYGTQILRYDQAREQTHRCMMRLHFLAGDRTAALRQFAHCTTVLKEELGVEPTELTVELQEQIKHNCLDDNSPALLTNGHHEDSAAPFMGVLKHLKQLQHALAEMQQQVRQDIQTVEQALQNRR
ncbi:MAG TPA: BTAD domain-containing putative transcriptional regulator [Roseiflexaceae bacterium]|jgi:DNA-binding SARP family transcriptional activator|nr:BTAD domain-containing putative transcriptional regulator [Roseiflexaceae bacterium]